MVVLRQRMVFKESLMPCKKIPGLQLPNISVYDKHLRMSVIQRSGVAENVHF